VLPDRLVGVGVTAAFAVIVAAEYAAIEAAEFPQRFAAGLNLLPRQVAAAARAAVADRPSELWGP
jgi:hypothetical protein